MAKGTTRYKLRIGILSDEGMHARGVALPLLQLLCGRPGNAGTRKLFPAADFPGVRSVASRNAAASQQGRHGAVVLQTSVA